MEVKLPRFFNLLLQAASEKRIWFKNEHGQMESRFTSRAALNELKRPPFVNTAPTQKRVWTQEEIDQFYAENDMYPRNAEGMKQVEEHIWLK